MCDLPDGLPAATVTRIRAHQIRNQLEVIATGSFSATVGKEVTGHQQVAARLLTLLPAPTDEGWQLRYLLVRRAQYCYAHTCDVLHGRTSALNVSPTRMREWDELLLEILECWPEHATRLTCVDCGMPLHPHQDGVGG